MSRKIGYVKSGYAQGKGGFDHQSELLREAGCTAIYVDDVRLSGDFPRQVLSEALLALNSGDTFVVTELKRISRWIPEVTSILEKVKAVGALIEIVADEGNLISPDGRVLATTPEAAPRHTLDYEWHDEYLSEAYGSIIDCLASEKVLSIVKTSKGIQFVELCDEYHGCTLSVEQTRRLIA